MAKRQVFRISIAIALSVLCSAPHQSLAQGDMEGASDHPKVPRIEGTRIVAYQVSPYDEGVFIADVRASESGRNTLDIIDERKEGKLTRIIYEAPQGLSTLGILRNYQEAFASLGRVDEKYSCRDDTCPNNLGGAFIWRDSARMPTPYKTDRMLYSGSYYGNQAYWYAAVDGSAAQYSVSVYAAERRQGRYPGVQNWPAAGQNLIHVDIVESEAFEAQLEFVEADEIASKINETGRVALYGIQFDTDSTKLKPESSATLDEIAKALTAAPELSLFVVGHTDNSGTFEYNRDLSERRAQVVVNRLSTMHGIDTGRLKAFGVGPVAPIASNETEEGKALNRRVELVRQ